MPDPLYALEKLSEAVYVLATGAGRIQDRLYESAPFLVRAAPENIPDEKLRRMLTEILDDLTKKQPKHREGRVGATLRRMKIEKATAIARRIVELHSRLKDQVG
jgi:CRISPR/Cas system CSM-associated protein Csm2 small subunit